MKKTDAIKYFGNKANIAKALNIEPQAVYQWGEYVPKGRAFEIELMTKGKLKASFPKLKKAS